MVFAFLALGRRMQPHWMSTYAPVPYQNNDRHLLRFYGHRYHYPGKDHNFWTGQKTTIY